MKKTYQEPTTQVVTIDAGVILAGSVGVTSTKGIQYGGVDEDGSLDPASRRRNDHWED